MDDAHGKKSGKSPGNEAAAILTREDMYALLEIGRDLNAEITLEALLQNLLAKASQLTDSPDTSVILRHTNRDGLYVAAATGEKADWVLATFGRHSLKSIPTEGSKAGDVFVSGVSLVENKVEGHFKGVDEETSQITESMVCVPLSFDGSAIGVVQILNKRYGGYTTHDRVLLEHFAAHAAVAIKNAQLIESVLAHSGFYTQATDTVRKFEMMRELARPAHTETLTVMFVDMRGFTQLCQSISSPTGLQQLLNSFISMLAEEVTGREGIVNKFLGDGIMALFRHGQHAERAVKTAFRIVDRFGEMKTRWNDESSEQLDFLDIGIGIVTGEAIIGGIGSETVRDFTAVGSTVNLAAALEHDARDGRRIIVNHLTYNLVKKSVEAEALEDFTLKKPQQTHGVRHKRYALKNLAHQRKLFISHSHADREFVETRIVRPLATLGIPTWYAPDDIPKGANWPAEIRKGLVACTCMIVVISKNALGAKWVRDEVDIAVGSQRMTNKIIPLRLDETPPEAVNEYLMAVHGIEVRTTADLCAEIASFVMR